MISILTLLGFWLRMLIEGPGRGEEREEGR